MAIVQRVQEELYGSNAYKANKEPVKPSSNRPYSRPEADRNRKDYYRSEHRSREEQSRDKPKNNIKKEQFIFFNYNKLEYYITAYPDKKKNYLKKKV